MPASRTATIALVLGSSLALTACGGGTDNAADIGAAADDAAGQSRAGSADAGTRVVATGRGDVDRSNPATKMRERTSNPL